MHPRIQARSLPEANDDIIRLGPRTAIVSIGEPGTPAPYGFQPMNPLHLRLEFHDVGDDIFDDGRIVAPSAEHVVLLLDRAKILRTAELVYCHCNAGISRSTAVAFILRCLWTAPGDEAAALAEVLSDRPQAMPNEVLVRIADVLMARGGAMIRAVATGE